MLCVYVRKLGGEVRIGKGEEISFVWREGKRWWGGGGGRAREKFESLGRAGKFPLIGLTGYGFYVVCIPVMVLM